MNMDENRNPIKKRLSEQLPSHSPDAGSWQRLSAKLDAMHADAAYQDKLNQLPLHSPDQGAWNVIYGRLNRAANLKIAARIALSAAAVLLLFFGISRFTDTKQQKISVPGIASHVLKEVPPAAGKQSTILTAETPEPQVQRKYNKRIQKENHSPAYSSGTQNSVPPETEIASNITENITPQETKEQVPTEIKAEPLTQNTAIHDVSVPLQEIANTAIEPKIAALQEEQKNTSGRPAVKYYTPKELKQAVSANHFALAMNYLPENINNGTDNSLFHNVDFTASYNKEKVRYNTSLGMAYNEEQLNFDMNYDIKTPVTAVGPGGKIDTLSYDVASIESQYQGTEKHQYLTYNLGIGRKLFSIGKFSSWINAGAGFGIRLNNPDLISKTEKTIKGQYNALITSVNISKPVYNDVNVNFVTGIDFNYRILNRISLTFTPTSRWYFKPVLMKDNQATDELTLGFRTGMKFDF